VSTPPPAVPPPWAAVRALFDRVVELPAADRAARLADPALDAGLVAEVRSLREHHERDTRGALSDGAAPAAAAPAPNHADRRGERLGAWLLVEPLGSGGMGQVWLAERADGAFHGQAAIKLLKPGMDSAAVLARFAQEQQALARLAHPHIARLLDAGRSAAGQPFFVMERVQGQPIDRACEGQPLAARVALFLQLADAVAHAHRHLLVHRDLKPSNVLVDGERQVKLLDFGIAKALDPLEGGSDPGATLAGERPFTPHYASPEQVRGEPVSTATDIYSLGVLLYVLLTGQRPYGRNASTPAAAAQSVLDEQPTRPSSLRRPEPGWERTRRQLEGDLDNILLKALDKNAAERYASVDALAADVRAWLEGRPVSARAATPWYITAKFLRRHRAAALAAALGVIGLATGLAATLLQGRVVLALGASGLAAGLVLALVLARRAELSRDEAARARDDARAQLQAVQQVTSELVFRFGDTVMYMPGGAKAQDALLAQTQAVLEPIVQRRADDDELQALLASVLSRRGQLRGDDSLGGSSEQVREGQALLSRCIAIGERVWATQKRHWRFADTHGRALWIQANLWRQAGRETEAEAQVRQTIARLQEALPYAQGDLMGRSTLGVQIANNTMGLGQTLQLRRPHDALDLLAQAEPTLRALVADTAWQAAIDAAAPPGETPAGEYVRHQLGTLLAMRAVTQLRLDDPAAARDSVDEAMPLRRANVAASPQNLAWLDGLAQELHHGALARLRLGDAAGALERTRELWALVERLAAQQGPTSKWPGMVRLFGGAHARALWLCGEPAAALSVIDAALAVWQREPPTSPNGRMRLAQLHALQGAISGRAEPLHEALALYEPLFADPAFGRTARLDAAEAGDWLAGLAGLAAPEASALRGRASAWLHEAAAEQPLGPDHAALLARMSSPA
jgi:eukaryotic-like serine/threonine-protein kinase